MKKTIDDLDCRGKRVIVRADLNVPLDASGRITDDRRIREALPTLRTLLDAGARLILMSHLGRPEGKPDDRRKYTMAPVANRLSELLRRPVRLLPDCVGPEVKHACADMPAGSVFLLENLRFHDEETIKDKDGEKTPDLRKRKDRFAEQIATLADAYVNDAFGTCHRDNASMLTVPKMMRGKPKVLGYLVAKELKFLSEAVTNPKRPFVCILGGAKVSDKLGVIKSLLSKCDTILVGGAMAYTFLAADGRQVGRSLVEPDRFDIARDLRKLAGDKLVLPVDSIAAAEIKPGVPTMTCTDAIPDELIGLDIGPRTIERFMSILSSAKTVVWNGPMGVFETPPFDAGTLAIARALADCTKAGATTLVGGGDSAAAVDKAGVADQMTHISTGGGASLEFLEGRPFKPLEVLDDA
jgi:phosphoglycerate kinase